jgi:hypothetical protein
MALGRLLVGWIVVVVGLLLWDVVGSRIGGNGRNGPRPRARVYLVEAGLLTMLAALWFGTLGTGGWWLVFGLVGMLREWPGSTSAAGSLLRVARTLAAGGLLAWRLGPT